MTSTSEREMSRRRERPTENETGLGKTATQQLNQKVEGRTKLASHNLSNGRVASGKVM